MLRLLLLLSLIAAVSGAYFTVHEREAYLPSAQAAPTEAEAAVAAEPQTPEQENSAEAPAGAAPAQAPAPQQPAASTAAQQTPAPAGGPVRLIIPAIGLNSAIVRVGTNSVGEMDVPSGSTNNIGWYSKGVVPGTSGSAVMGAHVYAGFSKLHKVRPGSEIYVQTESGGRLRFVVTDAKTYELSTMSADALFNRKGGKFLHLITCAGELTADGSTYTHRRVVYATLAE